MELTFILADPQLSPCLFGMIWPR